MEEQKARVDELQDICRRNPDTKAYLDTKVYPYVRNALEALLKEIDFRKLRVDEGEDLPEIQPLLFLAQYLMRHNPIDVPAG
jgi:hypothetical protein